MSWLPGWNSAESAGWWSSFHFWFGIACLFLLGGSEILSHFYGLRRDELIAAAESVAATQRAEHQQEEDQRRATETADLQRRAMLAEEALAKVRAAQLPRDLSAQQEAALTATGTQFHGQKFTATSIMGDDEGARFRDKIVASLDAAGWDHEGGAGIAQAVFTQNPVGISVLVNEADARANKTQAAGALIDAFIRIGLMSNREGAIDPNLQPGQIGIVVGRKPATP